MSREYTNEEVREQFLEHIRNMIEYWDSFDNKTSKDKLEGLAFSICVALDGGSSALPSFIVAPYPHEDDKQYNIENEENYYPQLNCEVDSDIAGCLHDLLFRK